MSAQIIDGNKTAEAILHELTEEAARFKGQDRHLDYGA